VGSEGVEGIEEGDRIRPSGEAHHEQLPAGGHTTPLKRPANGRRERGLFHRPRRPGEVVAVQGFEPRTPRI
jgi:hypothetical protein